MAGVDMWLIKCRKEMAQAVSICVFLTRLLLLSLLCDQCLLFHALQLELASSWFFYYGMLMH